MAQCTAVRRRGCTNDLIRLRVLLGLYFTRLALTPRPPSDCLFAILHNILLRYLVLSMTVTAFIEDLCNSDRFVQLCPTSARAGKVLREPDVQIVGDSDIPLLVLEF